MSLKFREEKQKIINKLAILNNTLAVIENDYQVKFTELRAKTNQAISNIKDDIFSIAFFGAFSDGKSTVISVLMNRLDIEIAPTPTTDKINTHKFQDYQSKDYQLIDTPGLFSENQTHDELTKKYISDANIIVYTVDPVNPLKDSHLLTVKWILSDLKKFDSTIFVINKMDEIADLEDDNDFLHNSDIKMKVVSDTINDIIGVDKSKKIVCIAADPFEKGLEYWHQNSKKYKKLSRINNLENMLSEFKEKYKSELIIKAGISVIQDAKDIVLKELNKIKNALLSEIDLLTNQIKEYDDRIKVLEVDVNRSYISIKEEFISLRGDLLVEIDAVNNMTELGEVMQKLLGKDGYILQERIDLIIKKYTGNLLSESKKIFESLEESLVYHSNIQNELLGKLSGTGKSVIKVMLSAPTRKIANAILKTRNFLKLPLKFKPWGALKFAKILKSMPVVIEALELTVGVLSKLKMDKKRNEIKEEIKKAFKELIQNLTFEKYSATYFPFIVKTQNVLTTLQDSKAEIQETISKISLISNELKINELN